MVCKEKLRLVKEFSQASKEFASAAKRLNLSTEKTEFFAALGEVQIAREQCRLALKTIENHLKEHECSE